MVGVQVFESVPAPTAAAATAGDDKPLAADRQSNLDGENGLLHFGCCEQTELSDCDNAPLTESKGHSSFRHAPSIHHQAAFRSNEFTKPPT